MQVGTHLSSTSLCCRADHMPGTSERLWTPYDTFTAVCVNTPYQYNTPPNSSSHVSAPIAPVQAEHFYLLLLAPSPPPCEYLHGRGVPLETRWLAFQAETEKKPTTEVNNWVNFGTSNLPAICVVQADPVAPSHAAASCWGWCLKTKQTYIADGE